MSIHLQLEEYDKLFQKIAGIHSAGNLRIIKDDVYQEIWLAVLTHLDKNKELNVDDVKKYVASIGYTAALEYKRKSAGYSVMSARFFKPHQRAVEAITKRLQRKPTNKEIADELEITPTRYRELLTRSQMGKQQTIKEYDLFCDYYTSDRNDPFEQTHLSRFIDKLEKKRSKMGKNEYVGLDFYLESLETTALASKRLGLSESYLTPSAAIRMLKTQMHEYNPFACAFYEKLLDDVKKRDEEVIQNMTPKIFKEMLVYLEPKLLKLLEDRKVVDIRKLSKADFICLLKDEINPIEKQTYLEKEIQRHFKLGYSQNEVRGILGCQASEVREVAKTHGLTAARELEKTTKESELDSKFQSLTSKGYTITEVQYLLGIDNAKANEIKNRLECA